ncbi:MAG: hypothetical protein M3464_13070 [Chloroflexota bacterium]|nr:hypothetical protein [Chloroflexota bacterium]
MTSRSVDLARQGLTIFGAVFQVVAGALTGPVVAQIANDYRTPILPSGYAFAIWTPIFLLAFIYAGWQALPAQREHPLLRRIGWFIAAGYIGNGLWELLFPAGRFLLAQVVITAILGVLALAYLGLVRGGHGRKLTGAERWLVAMPLGLYFGWITAATCVGLAATLAVNGVADAGSGAMIVGVALLLIGGAFALAMIRAGLRGPREAWLAYAVAVIWAVIGVAANQLGPSPVSGSAAIVIAGIVLAVVVWQLATSRNGERMIGQAA